MVLFPIAVGFVKAMEKKLRKERDVLFFFFENLYFRFLWQPAPAVIEEVLFVLGRQVISIWF